MAGRSKAVMAPLTDAFFTRPVVEVAKDLIGCTLLHEGIGGIIVETEAYHHEDPASHSFNGPTPRNGVMFGPVGRLYVYRSYGIHWCANIVAGTARGSAVLLRALAPTHGIEAMQARRGVEREALLCSGPGRLTQALGITAAQNGLALERPPLLLLPGAGPYMLLEGRRIGLTKGVETPWRFGLAGSPSLSRPFPRLSAAAARPAGKA